MGAIDELLGEIEEKEKSIKESIRSEELKLGILAVSLREVLGLKLGARLLESSLEASAALLAEEQSVDNSSAYLSSYRSDEEKKAALLREKNRTAEDERRLSIRLGAMIYEECSFSLLDKDFFRVVYDDVEADRRLEKTSDDSFFSRIFGTGKAKMRKLGEESRFISYASIALASSRPLGSDSANALLADLVKLREQRKKIDEEITALESRLENEKERAKNAEHEILEGNGKITGLKKAEEDAFVSYGSYLYDRGSEWIDKDTPSEILDVLESLLRLHGDWDSVIADKDRVEREAKADDYRAMIESEEGKIMVLEKEKERIDREIDEIKGEIDVLRNKIERLGL